MNYQEEAERLAAIVPLEGNIWDVEPLRRQQVNERAKALERARDEGYELACEMDAVDDGGRERE